MSVVITIMNLIATFIMCQVTNTTFSLAAGIDVLGFSFLQTFIYLTFALLLATFFRRSGVAIIVFFLYGLIIEWIIFILLHQINPSIGFFLPLQIADGLVVFQPLKTKGAPYDGLFAPYIMLLIALSYAGLYVFLTVRKYKYDDL